MDKILDNLLNNPGSDVDTETVILLRDYLASKSSEERIALVINMKNPKFVTTLLRTDEERLVAYSQLRKILLRDFSRQIYDILLDVTDEKLIIKYYGDIQLKYLKKEVVFFIRDDKLKFNYITKSNDDENKYFMACSLQSDELKYNSLEYIRDICFKKQIICSIQDESLRARALMILVPDFRMDICETITNQDILCNLYKKNIEYGFSYKLLCLIHNDNLKKECLNRYPLPAQIEIINSFDDEKNIQAIIWDSKYDSYSGELVINLRDENFIIKYFMKTDDLNFKIKIINSVNNNLKIKLIYLLDDVNYQKVLLGNINNDKGQVLRDVSISEVKFDIDPKITIGVELEVCGDCSETYLTIKKLLCDWDIKTDRTVAGGIEITSPILNYQATCLKELKFVCEFLKQYNFYTNDSCGGHIHFGFDYFETIDEFKTFIMLYQHVEDIIYLISNRSCSIVRRGIDKYAKKLGPVINKININWEKIKSLPECIELIKFNCGSRYYGLNVWNAFDEKNTIEFRMPNGEVEFTEILLNIRLFTKMMEVSKKITSCLNKTTCTKEETMNLKLYQQIICDNISDEEKLLLLLNLLFDKNEHSAYLNRYVSNRTINKIKKL